MSEQQTAAAVHRRFVDEVVVSKRLDLLDDLFHPEALVEQGSLELLRAQMQAQATGLDMTVSYLHEFVDGDWAVHHMQIAITHVGEFAGRPPTGRVTQLNEVEAARVVDGRIVEMWSVADVLSAMLQLGFPLPETDD
jgi:SnoaL-like polyketide cyclase